MEKHKAIAASAVIISILMKRKRKRRVKKRSCWCRSWLGRRETLGAYNQLLQELRLEDPWSFRNFLRMNEDSFNELLQMVAPLITKQNTNMREAISPGERLALTLRFLASGNSYHDLQYLYRVARNTISVIIPETCAAIYDALSSKFMKVPGTAEEWEKVSDDFLTKWNFPNCIGALDGKHVHVKKPAHSSSAFYNYKGFFSIVLMALVDANYRFIYIDVGANGRNNDASVFNTCSLSAFLQKEDDGMLKPKALPSREKIIPKCVIGDEIFGLKPYLMKPFPGRQLTAERRIYNYRLSRARRIVENAFGIMASRFGIFQSSINLDPVKAEVIVLACCALHNFLCTKSLTTYLPDGCVDVEVMGQNHHEMVPGRWRNEIDPFVPLQRNSSNRCTRDSKAIQQEFVEYFNSEEGSVPWQWRAIQ